ncbi:MAG TPA: acyl-CoA dehydrogenase family protein [Acidimicrobiia bacterium]|nr:acyl-CoA dehydrogenase family protein [Acidimicrobiia bacterium]
MTMPSPEDVRAEVKAWLEENWNPDLTVAQWWDILARSGYAAPTFPEDAWGKGWPRDLANVVNEAIAEHGAIGPPAGLGYLLTAPTLVAHGTESQKQVDLLRILNGQDAWCQLFSEPGAGSDLASLGTKAVLDGDEWIITGQKVWTSTAQLCNLGMLIARTAPELPKHKGITYFKFDMRQPGVEIRPLREMTGRALFNEVFIDNARVHNDDVIGGLNNGWAATNTTLMAERAGLGTGGSGAAGNAFPGPIAAQLDDRAGDHVGQVRTGGTGGGGVAAAQRLMTLAKELGKNTDPNIRQKLAKLYTMQQLGKFSSLRSKTPSQRTGGEPNIAKLMMSDLLRLQREVGHEIIGPHGMIMGTDTPGGGIVQEVTLFSPGPSIYGGTDQVQRNILGERVLGLPKEPGPAKDTAYKDLLVNS